MWILNHMQCFRSFFFVLTLAILLFCSNPVDSAAQTENNSKPPITSELFSRGEALYQKQCSVCHGPEGGADGKAAYLLYPKPRDFIRDKFRLVSTTNMQATDEDLFKTITRGMAGSAMPPWKQLSVEDRWALVYYVRFLSEVDKFKQSGELFQDVPTKDIPWELKKKMINKQIDPATLVSVPVEPAITEETLQRGRELFLASCAGCHGQLGKGDGQQEMKDNLGYHLKPRDLTAGIYKGDASSPELYRRMVAGMPGSPMPSYTGVFQEPQIWDLIHYVQSLSPSSMPVESASIKALKVKGTISLDPADPVWSGIEPSTVLIAPLWWHDECANQIQIRVIYDKDKIAFHLSWKDAAANADNVAVHGFSDGVAVQLSAEADPPFFGMGDKKAPIHLWHWKAAWQNKGEDRKDVETRYPDMAVDWYKAQKDYKYGDPFEVKNAKTQFHDPEFTTGWGAGNPVSDPLKKESAEEAVAEGLGSYTTQKHSIDKVDAQGSWADGQWQVVFVRSLRSKDKAGLQFDPKKEMNVALGVWDGEHHDRNGQKAVSIWIPLIFEK